MTTPADAAPEDSPHVARMHMVAAPQHARHHDKAHSAQAEHCTMVIFGATGDLTKRKLFPALYQLAEEHLLAPGFAVLAVGRESSLNDDSFRERMRAALGESDEIKRVDDEVWQAFAKRIFFVGGDATDIAAYTGIKAKLDEIEATCEAAQRNRFFYLAVPPSVFEPSCGGCRRAGSCRGSRTLRLGRGRASWWRSRSAGASRRRAR